MNKNAVVMNDGVLLCEIKSGLQDEVPPNKFSLRLGYGFGYNDAQVDFEELSSFEN